MEMAGNGLADRLKFTDINANEVAISRRGNDLVVTVLESAPGGGDGGSIVLKDSLDHSFVGLGVETIAFADGSIWTRAQIRQMLLDLMSTAGDDGIVGFNTDDVLVGKAGDDGLNGMGGNDTYVYSRDDGTDTITEAAGENSYDRLVLTDISSSEVTVQSNGSFLFIKIAATPGNQDGGTIAISDAGAGIEQVVFADTSWTHEELMLAAGPVQPSAGSNIIGGNGNDHFWSQLIATIFSGGSGNDSYHLNPFSLANETITEQTTGSDIDTLFLQGLRLSDISIQRLVGDTTSLVIRVLATDRTITLKNQFQGTGGVERIVLDDITLTGPTIDSVLGQMAVVRGTDNADYITAVAGSSQYQGGLGDDVIKAGATSQTYIYAKGDGSDWIDDENASTSDVDVLKLDDLNPEDVQLSREGVHLKIKVLGTGHVITIDEQYYRLGQYWGIEKIVFADGTSWSRDDITKYSWVRGTAAGEWLYSYTGLNETFVGGGGDDVFRSGEGNHTYIYTKGDGSDWIDDHSGSRTDVDTLKFTDLNAADIEWTRSGTHLKMKVLATGETITIQDQLYEAAAGWGVELITFSDGTSWNRSDISAHSWVRGTVAGEWLYASGWMDDTFIGGGGDDVFSTGSGNQTYIYAAGDGSDWIDDNSGSRTDVDTLKFTDLNACDLEWTRSGSNLQIKVLSTGHTITVEDQLYEAAAGWGIEVIKFADGTSWGRTDIIANSWVRGTAAGETLSSKSWMNDTFIGAGGDDVFRTGAGSQTYIYAKGDGNDWIDDESPSVTDVDILKLIDLNSDEVSLVKSGAHLKINILETGEVITIDEQFYSASNYWGIEQIVFADGSSWDRAQITANLWYA